MPLNGWLQVGTFTCLLTAVALDVSRARLTHGATVSALGNWSTLLVDVLKRAVYRRIVVSTENRAKLGAMSMDEYWIYIQPKVMTGTDNP